MAWWDVYKLYRYVFEADPTERKEKRDIKGAVAGITQPDIPPNLLTAGQEGGAWGGRNAPLKVRLGDSTDFIDLSSVTNRISRYKEYDRLQNVSEIETALNTFADEACVAGNTPIMTPFGPITIEELANTKKENEKFLVYCWDFKKGDYGMGWAWHPRKVKVAKTIKIMLDDGTDFVCTEDHRVLLKNEEWIEAGQIKRGDELMPFYRVKPNRWLTELKTNQFPRVFTFKKGWVHERQFIDEWKTNKDIKKYEKLNKVIRFIQEGLNVRQLEKAANAYWPSIAKWLKKEGFTKKEVEWLCKKHKDTKHVVGVAECEEMPVYDLSVEEHKNFATDSVILHNCQEDDNGHVFKVKSQNDEVKRESEILLRKILEMDSRAWGIMKNLCKYGDYFLELIIDPEDPKKYGIVGAQPLPPDSIYRIETIKGRLIEFQQTKEGPDYQSLARVEVTKASRAELAQAAAIRFTPEQIIHMRQGDERKDFYPYGVSMIEAARGPAHQLRLMEDAMLVYRLTRAPERRVFYIDVGQLPPFKAESFMERMKDQFRKKKVFSRKRNAGMGASAVEERWHAPAQDEDYWLPIRPNANTRVETLPGASNLGEIDDALYFRNKLFVALNFPKNYLSNDDPQATRLTLSQQDVRFARLIERIQKPLQKGMQEIVLRHLRIKGYPEELYEDLEVEITPPSDWRKINRNEVTQAMFDRAATLKGSQLMADYDILTRILEFDEDEAKEMVSRMKAQKMEELQLQALGANPELLGINTPEQEGTELGTQPGGPSPMIGGPEGEAPPEGEQPPVEGMPPGEEATPEGEGGEEVAPSPATQTVSVEIPEPSEEDIKKYDLEIIDYSRDLDVEEVDETDVE